MFRSLIVAVAAVAMFLCATTAAAQQDTTHKGMPGMQMPKQDSSRARMPVMHGPHPDTMTMQMSMDGPLGISMERMGSGTTWIPDAVMLPARHAMVGQWSVMLHGFAFAQYDRQGGTRGRGQFGSLNWAMIMASRSV
ncbi:MAG: hypothetical protein ACJ77T_03145, partial [Gemmatimonadaceae bacterium]